VVGILISLVAFWLIVKDVNPAQMVAAFTKANYWWIIPSTLFMIAAMGLRAQRWRVFLASVEATRYFASEYTS
ncbi:MAG: lysylphosphatidylglycerol synthase domain-containing protein, partial [Patescibacteria group bacterium]